MPYLHDTVTVVAGKGRLTLLRCRMALRPCVTTNALRPSQDEDPASNQVSPDKATQRSVGGGGTLFTLDWILSSDLHRRAQLGLNKGEARNMLARAVFFNRLVNSRTAGSRARLSGHPG